MMRTAYVLLLTGWLSAAGFPARSQRTYAPHSVLSTGNWYQLSVSAPGVYKIDIPFLNSLGVSTGSIPSASVRLFGNGGQVIPEANSTSRPDDLVENAIRVVDGGDGILNGTDYILFYANGPDEWLKDSVNQRFVHRKNIYADRSYYFLQIGGTGLRIPNAPVTGGPGVPVTSYNGRFFHELDTVNFLASGKEWYGEELSSLPGRSLSRQFALSLPNAVAGSPLLIRTQCAARSAGASSRFDIRVNDVPSGQLPVNAVGGGPYDAFAQQNTGFAAGTATGANTVTYTYVPGSFNAQGWINWLEAFTRCQLSFSGQNQLLFRDWASVGAGTAGFVISQASANTEVWDITDPLHPQQMQGVFSGTEFRFQNSTERLREYVAFNPGGFLQPVALGKISNQDLHNAAPADYIVITDPSLPGQAQRLARLHQQQSGLRVLVVTTAQVYNEFGSGTADPSAIRDFVKMYFDKYNSSPADRLKYLLLFGDASFDYKDRLKNNTSLVPAWQSDLSLDPLATYASDDFYGFLEDHEDISSGLVLNLLDVGIGRVPARNPEEAKNFVDKLEAYFAPQSMGPWRNNLTFIADDEDNNLHLQDAELITSTAATTAPALNQQKIYLDAFQQESGAGGSRYPLANQASNNQVYNGTLIWNYNGHGGASRLAEEVILDQDAVNGWNNPNKLPLFITATCDFAPYDNPVVNSLGENILLRPKTGAIALMTTTRLVFAFSNRVMNNNYIRFALEADASGRYRTLGEAVKDAKNYTYQTSPDLANNRKFTLLGDPALTLAFPRLKVRTTLVNGIPASQADTLSAAENVLVEGEVTDLAGNLLSSFNGYVYPVVFDKARDISTLANDPGSQVTSFRVQANALFKGKAAVSGGRFSFRFKMPRDINYQYGPGRLSLYAEDGSRDAGGLFTNMVVGGIGTGADNDREGPEIRPYLNDELFANGGITNQRPVLLVKLADSSGINTTGAGIGHDLVATLDDDNRQYFILNDYYLASLNSYQQGEVRFQLPELSPGPHSLKIKAWDVLNNSGEAVIDFVVANDEELQISHVLNYPNPFTTSTTFWFEHNKPGLPLQVQVEIMTITGRVVKTFSQVITTDGNRSASIVWDGKDEEGARLGRGVYLYKLRVTAPGKKSKTVLEKLVIL